MDVKYQVFVSSTFVDLQEERRTVIEMILNMGHIPVGMEAFQASDDTQWDYIKRRIDESDYYVLIVAERYGSEQNGKSYTQMEYEYAVKTGVPVVAFLLDSATRKDWPSSKVEHDKKEKVEKFRRLCQKKLVKFWRNSDDLGGKVGLALSEVIRDKPRTGWVRADSVPSVHVLEEVARLSEEKRSLQDNLRELSDGKTLIIPPDVLYRINKLLGKHLGDYIPAGDKSSGSASLLEVFIMTSNTLAIGCTSYQAMEIWRQILSVEIDRYDAAETVLAEFSAQNLIDFEIQVFPKTTRKTYSLTSYGKDFLMYASKYFENMSAEPISN